MAGCTGGATGLAATTLVVWENIWLFGMKVIKPPRISTERSGSVLYACIHTFIYIQILIYTDEQACRHTNRLIYIHTYIYTYIEYIVHTYIHTSYIHSTYIHRYIQTYIHTYRHTYREQEQQGPQYALSSSAQAA
jgi:hypothetical protein